ncbi:MAG TPA: VOC family protein [Candidatus Binataceae bacterium]|nr:VOC family protein [Candidatus Binataceae bacterium]
MISHRGLRHLALRVADVERAREFYARVFGMRLVWQPDADNVYMSSGCDNLALHRGARGDPAAQTLDHLGFIAASVAEVEAGFAWAVTHGLDIVKPLAHHRDGSVSFYLRDLDGNVVQVLYEPAISSLDFVANK